MPQSRLDALCRQAEADAALADVHAGQSRDLLLAFMAHRSDEATPPESREPLAVKEAPAGPLLLTLGELDAENRWWRVDNEYVLFGYRPPLPPDEPWMQAAARVAGSLFSPVHNQTAAIWTHLLGCVAVGVILARTFAADGPMRAAPGAVAATSLDYAAMALYLCGALSCLFFSALFHLCCDAGKDVRRLLIKFDFAGVLLLVWGSWLTVIQFGLACSPRWVRISYFSSITSLVFLVALLCLHPQFARPAYRAVRAGVFLTIGWVGLMPAVQLLCSAETRPIGLGCITMGVLYSVGTLVDVMKVPERWAWHFGNQHPHYRATTVTAAISTAASVVDLTIASEGEDDLLSTADLAAAALHTAVAVGEGGKSKVASCGNSVGSSEPTSAPPRDLWEPPDLPPAERNGPSWAKALSFWGSHAIFHCFVVAALLVHYRTSLGAWAYKNHGCHHEDMSP